VSGFIPSGKNKEGKNMKFCKVWLLIVFLICFFYISFSSNISAMIDNPENTDILYFNGYLNFCFNGITKIFVSNGLVNDNNVKKEPIFSYTSSPNDDVIDRIQRSLNNKANEMLNDFLKKTVGRDINDMVNSINSLPLQ